MFFKKKKESAPAAAVSAGAISGTAAGTSGISDEIIAVIAAAIAAMTESGASGGLIIRKISRAHGEKLTWSSAGLMECIDSRRF